MKGSTGLWAGPGTRGWTTVPDSPADDELDFIRDHPYFGLLCAG